MSIWICLSSAWSFHRPSAGRLASVFLFEEDVVILVALERRVDVTEVHRLRVDLFFQDVQVVAVVKRVFHVHPFSLSSSFSLSPRAGPRPSAIPGLEE